MNLEHRISHNTELEPQIIIDKILSFVKQRKYGVTTITDKSVAFDGHYTGLLWKHEQFGRFQNGKFEIVSDKTLHMIVFEYKSLALSEVIFISVIFSAISILSIVNNFYLGIVVASIFPVMMIAELYYLKKLAKKILLEIAC